MYDLSDVYKWVEHFKHNHFNIEGVHQSGSPVELSIPSLQQHVDEMINHYR